MRRQEKYPDTKTFHYYNANPHNRITGDCSIRAVAFACQVPYNQVVMDLARIQCETGYDSDKGMDILLKEYGWIKNRQPRHSDNTKFTVAEFVKVYKRGTYILNMAGHNTVVKDGVDYDIWDCVKYGGTVGNYWTRG